MIIRATKSYIYQKIKWNWNLPHDNMTVYTELLGQPVQLFKKIISCRIDNRKRELSISCKKCYTDKEKKGHSIKRSINGSGSFISV